MQTNCRALELYLKTKPIYDQRVSREKMIHDSEINKSFSKLIKKINKQIDKDASKGYLETTVDLYRMNWWNHLHNDVENLIINKLKSEGFKCSHYSSSGYVYRTINQLAIYWDKSDDLNSDTKC